MSSAGGARAGSRTMQRRLVARRAARRRRLTWAAGLGAVAVVAVVAAVAFIRAGSDDVGRIVVPSTTLPEVPIEGRILGNPNAPVHVVEYGDYQCPGCGVFARDFESRLISDFVVTGQASFEYRDFAFIGDDSERAAEAAACALDEGAFWAYHKTLFYNQDGENAGAFRERRLRAMAEELGLDADRFGGCLGNGTHADEVEAMRQEAQDLGVSGTPSFFVNGERVEYRGYESVAAAIERHLAARS